MTEQLKTLKDIDVKRTEHFIDESVLKFRRDLKAEAIKWVKKYKERDNDGTGDFWRAIAFMSFFNLTEEDLK